ncbi:MAG: XTP/dITP diphosphatase [Pseudomonadota bacterium]
MKIVLATQNRHKVEELTNLLDDMNFQISSIYDYPEIPDVVEDGATFLENARKKARVVCLATGSLTLADDSGLVVEALAGQPGVRSARYAGGQGDYAANNRKLLDEMKDVPDGRRGAAFVCNMVLASPDGREWDVEGRCEGIIGHAHMGSGGFGYDPLFFVPSEGRTMAELAMDRKNKISHRGRALAKMRKILIEILK